MMDVLSAAYLWMKTLHVISVIAWMAGLFYLPRLFVYHVEKANDNPELDLLFQTMERRLLHAIMAPAMIATWFFGLALAVTPGIVEWTAIWPWTKLTAIVGMTWFHMWCSVRRKEFATGHNTHSGRYYRIANEVPTLLLIVIVVSVVARPF